MGRGTPDLRERNHEQKLQGVKHPAKSNDRAALEMQDDMKDIGF